MPNRIIQLQPWHDTLLALTEQGEVYELSINPMRPSPPTAILLFPGIPVER